MERSLKRKKNSIVERNMGTVFLLQLCFFLYF